MNEDRRTNDLRGSADFFALRMRSRGRRPINSSFVIFGSSRHSGAALGSVARPLFQTLAEPIIEIRRNKMPADGVHEEVPSAPSLQLSILHPPTLSPLSPKPAKTESPQSRVRKRRKKDIEIRLPLFCAFLRPFLILIWPPLRHGRLAKPRLSFLDSTNN